MTNISTSLFVASSNHLGAGDSSVFHLPCAGALPLCVPVPPASSSNLPLQPYFPMIHWGSTVVAAPLSVASQLAELAQLLFAMHQVLIQRNSERRMTSYQFTDSRSHCKYTEKVWQCANDESQAIGKMIIKNNDENYIIMSRWLCW